MLSGWSGIFDLSSLGGSTDRKQWAERPRVGGGGTGVSMKTLRSASVAPQKLGRRSQKGSSALRSSGTHTAGDSSAFDFTPSVAMRADTALGGRSELLVHGYMHGEFSESSMCGPLGDATRLSEPQLTRNDLPLSVRHVMESFN
ncbi:uncharacterized [Tachysurus ichikawai]